MDIYFAGLVFHYIVVLKLPCSFSVVILAFLQKITYSSSSKMSRALPYNIFTCNDLKITQVISKIQCLILSVFLEIRL